VCAGGIVVVDFVAGYFVYTNVQNVCYDVIKVKDSKGNVIEIHKGIFDLVQEEFSRMSSDSEYKDMVQGINTKINSKKSVVVDRAIDAEQFKPKKKIITPNRDGNNDIIDFNGFNLLLANGYKNIVGKPVKIYGVNGKLIKELDSCSVWDGTDNNGSVVESGVYIYQYEVNGKVVSGSVTVVK
jgi:gliding motility-associated-like protein